MSSAKQAQQGESLPVQKAICLEIAERNGWLLAHEPWLETFSGRKSVRPTFEEILAFLDRNPGVVRYYIFRSIDRFTRGGSYAYERMKQELSVRSVEMVDSHGVIQPSRNALADVGFEYEWSRFSPSKITETVLANTAEAEVNTILTRMIGQEIRLTQRGFKIRAPQDGYKNEKIYVEGKRRTIQVPDPDRAHFIVAMFEMRAAGLHTDQQICDHLNAIGYRRRLFRHWDKTHENIIGERGGGPLLLKRLQEIIQRPIYCGVVWEKWTNWLPVKAAYPGLVSVDTYNRANRGKRHIRETPEGLELVHDFNPMLVGKRLSRDNPLFPYKNVVLCPTCRKPFMGSSSRSKSGKQVPAYHCSRGHTRVAANKATFDSAVERVVNALRFVSDNKLDLRACLHAAYENRSNGTTATAAQAARAASDIEAEMAATVKAFKAANSAAMRRELELDVERLETELVGSVTVRDESTITPREIDAYLDEAEKIMEHPANMLLSPVNPQRQRYLYDFVFADLPTFEDIVSRTPKLSPVFWVSDATVSAETRFVRLRGLSWNMILPVISAWLRAR